MTYGPQLSSAMLLINTVVTKLRYEDIYTFLLSQNRLKDKILVTKVYSCKRYAVLFKPEGGHGLAFAGLQRFPHSPSRWLLRTDSGSWNVVEGDGEKITPLLGLRTIRRSRYQGAFTA